MPTSKHTPAPDAPAKEWTAFLKGRGYVKASAAKPVANYKVFHGYWVPPRLGSAAKGAVAAVKGSKPARAAASSKPNTAWYSERMLTTLYRTNRRTFDKLVERVQNIKALVAEQEAAERLAAHRELLEPAVEAGLLNQAEADRKLAAWAKAQGIKIPAS